MSSVEKYICDALKYLESYHLSISLKNEQRSAIEGLLCGKDVMAVLPTGFGKSMIFTVFSLAKGYQLQDKTSTVLVISPLKSLISDQIKELNSIGCSAVELSAEIQEIEKNPPRFIYASAEQALDGTFLKAVRDTKGKLHQTICAIVVDESHTVETWTGKRKRKGRSSKEPAFREAFGKLSMLRSMCKEGVPLLALTGTADQLTQKTIISELVMKKPLKIFVSPNRLNLNFSVKKVPKNEMFKELDWLIDMVKERGVDSPKTIIFCTTMNAIAALVNYLMMRLAGQAFHPHTSKKRENCLIGIFHSLTLEQYKERVSDSLKSSGVKRIVIATTALSMGVNFPDIRHVIMWGPPRSILDFHQEAGRAGRDGLKSNVSLIYYGQQTAHCEDEVRVFLKASGCRRVAAYSSLDPQITPLEPPHDCCSVCSSVCNCESETCTKALSSSSSSTNITADSHETAAKSRNVTAEDKEILTEALQELRDDFKSTFTPFGTQGNGFCDELIEDVVENANKLFSVEDVLVYAPVFSLCHAIIIMEVINDLFGDCDDAIENFDEADFQLFDVCSMSEYCNDELWEEEENEDLFENL